MLPCPERGQHGFQMEFRKGGSTKNLILFAFNANDYAVWLNSACNL